MLSDMPTTGEIFASAGEMLNLPVMFNQDAELGAIGLKISYPGNVKVYGLTSAIEGLEYNIENNVISLAWSSSSSSVSLKAGVQFVTIQCMVQGKSLTSGFQLSSESVIADNNAHVLGNDLVVMPRIILSSQNNDFSIMSEPNPFTSSTTISYNIPATCKVTITISDMLGREIETLVSEEQIQGNYTVAFNGSNLENEFISII